MLRFKSKKVKPGSNLNVMFTPFVQLLVENRIFPNTFNLITFETKCSADQILTLKSDFVPFDHLRVAIWSF